MKDIDNILALVDEFAKKAQITDEETFAEEPADPRADRKAQLIYLYDLIKENNIKQQQIRKRIEQELAPLEQEFNRFQSQWKKIQGNDPIDIKEILNIR